MTGVCALSSLVGCSGNHGTNKKTETTNKVANETTGEVLNAGMMNLEDDIFGNESYEQDTYKTVTGEEVKSDDERVVFYNATGYITPDAWKEKGIMANSDGTDLNISFFSTLFFEEINAMTEEEAASVTPEEFEDVYKRQHLQFLRSCVQCGGYCSVPFGSFPFVHRRERCNFSDI